MGRAILNDRDWYLRELATKLKKAEHRRKARVRWRECLRRELKRMKQAISASAAAISASAASDPCSSNCLIKSWNHDRMQMRKRHRFRPRVRSQLSDRDDSSSSDGHSSPIRARSDYSGFSFNDDARGVPFARFKSTPWGHS